ncbi:MAG: 50S ribosomal protein L18 [Bacteroidota bacterium]|nr:50S ribosomal protein L18 [Bacteroidota bacterium]|tara:strand:+ start:989 stop:1342 length:354 start_codon:yes stop_codon:yes gene_type:complete
MALTKSKRRERIKRRVRKNISGTSVRPRLTVFRSNKQIYAQVIDDENGVTLASAGSLKNEDAQKVNKTEQAKLVGKMIADSATKAGVANVVFDRNGYLYHGRIKALAESAREGGLKF